MILGLVDTAKKYFFKVLKKIPLVKNKIDNILEKINADFLNEIEHRNQNLPYITQLPQEGMSSEEILKLVDKYLETGVVDLFLP